VVAMVDASPLIRQYEQMRSEMMTATRSLDDFIQFMLEKAAIETSLAKSLEKSARHC
jgi:hypothetical protein